MTDWNSFVDGLKRQDEYSRLFFDKENLSTKEKEEVTKTFALSLHAEISDLVSSINLKNHRRESIPVDKTKILYKTVDIYRYMMAILNLWELKPEDFSDACSDKDLFLHARYRAQKRPAGKRVVIFDIDDVIAEFRSSFNAFLFDRYGIVSDPQDKQYYNTKEMNRLGLESESAFNAFISSGGFRELPVDTYVTGLMRTLKDQGYWIVLLTARPASNLKCFYDTYHWVENFQIPHDAIAFSPEKYLWLTGQEFFGDIVCAVDDSSKHASEYAKHGIKTIVPAKSYNEDVGGLQNLTRLQFTEDSVGEVLRLIDSFSK